MKNILLTFLIVGLTPFAYAQNAKLPIIDMHLHATDRLWSKTRPCFPQPCQGAPTEIKNISDLLPQTIEKMDKHNVVLAAVSWYNLEEVYRWGNADARFLTCPAIAEPMATDLRKIENDIKEGKIKVLGEVASQYQGYSMDDKALDPIFSLAEKYDLPILVHCAGAGGSNHFPILEGNPMTISKVIQKHPKLRIYIENAAWPFGDEIISLMYMYPNVYADLSTISWIIPKQTFHSYLKKLTTAGLGKRLMFGSDQMLWPEAIDIAIEAINSADFLTEEEKRDIFYNNAARFLRLSDEQIDQHHKKK
ncbi:MAG: amidohydrolase family protein [Saprospiraceae bacterium]